MGQAIGLIRLVPCTELENVERIDRKGWERETERQTERQTDRQTGRDRDRATCPQRYFASWKLSQLGLHTLLSNLKEASV